MAIDDEGGADVGGDGHPEVGQAEEGQDQDEGLGEQRQGDVLADPGQGGAAEADQPGEAAEVVGHEDDIGGLERGAAGDAAQGDADAGGGQGRGVVDAVADHAGRAVARGEVGDRRDLVGREQLGALLADAQLAGDGGGRAGVVAGEHDRPEAERVELGEDAGRLGPRLVGQADPAQRAGSRP